METALPQSAHHAQHRRHRHPLTGAIRRQAVWLGGAFRTPLGVNNPAETVGPRALYALLIGMLLSCAFSLSVGLPFFAVRKIASAVISGAMLISVLAALVISRRGHFRLAGRSEER